MAELKNDKTEDSLLLQISKDYNKNRQIVGQAPTDLFKGMRDGMNIEDLYLIAVKGLAACIDDVMLVPTAEKFLKERQNKQQ